MHYSLTILTAFLMGQIICLSLNLPEEIQVSSATVIF